VYYSRENRTPLSDVEGADITNQANGTEDFVFDNLLGVAKSLLGGAGGDASPEQVAGAVSEHIGSLNSGDLVNHFIGMIPNLPEGARTQLASTVMSALAKAGSSADSVEDAGVPVVSAMSGDHAALGALLEHATSNPAGLKDAAIQYISNNPQIIQQYAPDLLKGVLSKFGV